VLIAPDQFQVIPQILNEAPNLPDRLLERPKEEGAGDVASVVQAAREIQRSLAGATAVRLVIDRQGSVVGTGIEAFVSRDLLYAWRVLARAVIESFSEL
jgi:hypothetical protein